MWTGIRRTQRQYRTSSEPANSVVAASADPFRYLNNIVEQDHRARVRASQGFRASLGVANASENRSADMIRKGQVRWLAKNDIAGQVAFVGRFLGLMMA